MRPIWKNHWLLFRSTHSQKSPEKRDFVVHTHDLFIGREINCAPYFDAFGADIIILLFRSLQTNK